MYQTKVTVQGTQFLINGSLIYSEDQRTPEKYHGLLMNARFIQGIFDDKEDVSRFNRFGRMFDPSQNTTNLIEALPSWYEKGLRAFTVGLQGGGPCFTTDNATIKNNPFSEDGLSVDEAYLKRLHQLILAADAIGMVVIVSVFYPGQVRAMKNAASIVNALKTVCCFLKEKAYTNVMIEVCNEFNLVKEHAIIGEAEGMSTLIHIAKEASGGMLVGSSGTGGVVNQEVCEASDVVLIHGNGLSRQGFYRLIKQTKGYAPDKPIVCNEDSQAIGNMIVAMKEGVSWGYYNNMTKQEPPADWSITRGEDEFFAERLAAELGLVHKEEHNKFYLQGLEQDSIWHDQRWLRVASLYPETIDYVEFYNNGDYVDTCYVEPFSMHYKWNWMQGAVQVKHTDQWSAKVYLANGEEKILG